MLHIGLTTKIRGRRARFKFETSIFTEVPLNCVVRLEAGKNSEIDAGADLINAVAVLEQSVT